MNIAEHGQGFPIVVLHGSPAGAGYFDPLVQALAGRFRVLLPDLPGHGPSPLGDAPYTFERVNGELKHDLAARGIGELGVVGFSLGTYRALMLALEPGPLAVTGLYLFGAIAGFEPEVKAQFAGFAQLLRAGADVGPIWQQRAMSPTWAAAHPADLAAVMAWLEATPRETMAAEYDAMGQAPDLRGDLNGVAVPAVIRAGAEDGSWPLAWTEGAAAQLPGAVIQAVPGAGHALLYEDRPASVASVVAWARALAG